MNWRERAATAAALVLLWTGWAMAQAAANGAGDSGANSAAPVSYADVLAHPDDPAINLRWARTQISRDDLKGAAATLERMLLVDPNQPSVRLLYAVVLFRLGSYSEASEQLHTLDKVALDPAARLDVDNYLKQIDERLRGTHFWALGSVGVEYDSNRNLAPEGLSPVLPSLPPTLFAGPAVSDWGAIALGSLGVRQDLGLQGRGELTADATIYEDSQARVKALDTTAALLRVGSIWHADFATITANLLTTDLWLGAGPEFYYQNYGAEIRAERQLDTLDRRLSLFADGLALDEMFHPISLDPTAAQSTGGNFELTLGAIYRAGGGLTLSAAWQGIDKTAEISGLSYTGNNGILDANWVFAPGQFLNADVQYGVFPYGGIDPVVDPTQVRRDNLLDARLTYGVALANLFGARGPGDVLTGLTWSVSVEDIRDRSTIATYRSNDVRVLSLLTKRLDF